MKKFIIGLFDAGINFQFRHSSRNWVYISINNHHFKVVSMGRNDQNHTINIPEAPIPLVVSHVDSKGHRFENMFSTEKALEYIKATINS